MIKHIKCDIFESGADIICHQVNCRGVMGSGIAKQVRKKYPWVYGTYRDACESENIITRRELLGWSLEVYINETQKIANLFAQENYGYDGRRYTDYPSLKECLQRVQDYNRGKTIAIPYLMGCYRGGGDWNVVYSIIKEVFGSSDEEVLICEHDGN